MVTKALHSVVIGGTKGVGRAVCQLLAESGHYVTAVGRSSTGVILQLPGGGTIEHCQSDLEQPQHLVQLLLRRIDDYGLLSSIVFLQRYRNNGDSWLGEFQVAVEATRVTIDTLAGSFDPAGARSITIVGSNASQFVARNQSAGYHVSKAALRQLARYYAVRLGPERIRVNVVSPCSFTKPESEAFYNQPKLKELYQKIVPLGRPGTAVEVAQAVVFLCSTQASFITGQDLFVDGGMSLMLHDAQARELTNIHP